MHNLSHSSIFWTDEDRQLGAKHLYNESPTEVTLQIIHGTDDLWSHMVKSDSKRGRPARRNMVRDCSQQKQMVENTYILFLQLLGCLPAGILFGSSDVLPSVDYTIDISSCCDLSSGRFGYICSPGHSQHPLRLVCIHAASIPHSSYLWSLYWHCTGLASSEYTCIHWLWSVLSTVVAHLPLWEIFEP